MAKKRIVRDYEKLPDDIVNRIKLEYPEGYEENLITFTNAEGKYISALPFETEDVYYLVRMTESEARKIVKDDDDFGDDGKLRDDFGDDVGVGDVGDIEVEEEEEEVEDYPDDKLDEAEEMDDDDFVD